MRHRTKGLKARLILGAIPAAVALTLLSGCGSDGQLQSGKTAAPVDIDEHLPQAGLKQLTSESDLVVRGRVVRAKSGVLIAKDPTAKYTIFTIRVAEVVSGAKVSSVDVALLTELSGAPVRPEGRPAVGVGDDAVWLLTKIAPEFNRKGYVLTNQSSLLIVDDDGRVTGGSKSSAVAGEVAHMKTVNEVLRYLRSVAPR